MVMSWYEQHQRRIARRTARINTEARTELVEERLYWEQLNTNDHDRNYGDDDIIEPVTGKGINPHANANSLIGGRHVNWNANYFTDRVRDGVFDVQLNEETMSYAEELHIRETLRQIDEVTGIKVRIDRKGAHADLVMEKSDFDNYDSLTNLDHSNAAGLAFIDSNKVHAVWEDTHYDRDGLSYFTEYVITHEMLHGFGLMHPEDSGYNSKFNTSDTLMSYNHTGNSQLTDLDLAALSQVWG